VQQQDWKLTPPKPGEPTKKVVTINGKWLTYYWCPHHKRWTAHKSKDCRLKPNQPEPKQENSPILAKKTPVKKKEKKQGLALHVMNAILDDSDKEGEEQEEDEDYGSDASSINEQQSDSE
jgi:hypothetical protein